MIKIFKWLFFTALALIVPLLVAVFGLHRWVNTHDFRQRMERDASDALGVPVAVGSIQVDVWPLPAVALGNCSAIDLTCCKAARMLTTCASMVCTFPCTGVSGA